MKFGNSKSMYENSPKLERDKDTGKMGVGQKVNEAEKKASKPDEGIEGMPEHDEVMKHPHERRELAHKHVKEHLDMHHKHETQHVMHKGHKATLHAAHHEEKKAMHKKHEAEMQEMHQRHESAGGETQGESMIKQAGSGE